MAKTQQSGFRCVNLLGDFKSLRIDLVADMGVEQYRLPQMSSRKIINTRKRYYKNKAISQINIPK